MKIKNIYELLKDKSKNKPINYKDYINICLYDPIFGYYKKNRKRVGRNHDTDFYTAESLGNTFSELLLSSIQKIIGKNQTINYEFIEIANEPDYSTSNHFDKKIFKNISNIPHGKKVNLDNKKVIIFANEWLDSIPFHRIKNINGTWKELGVFVNEKHNLEETILDNFSEELLQLLDRLPMASENNQIIDLSIDAENEIDYILKQNWSGLFLLFDYGKSWKELTEENKSGTARTYYRHKIDNNLLDNPSEKDITCHICWDFILEKFNKNKFSSLELIPQESFFIKNASEYLKAAIIKDQNKFSKKKQTIMELIHPSNMGHKFQVLSALRK